MKNLSEVQQTNVVKALNMDKIKAKVKDSKRMFGRISKLRYSRQSDVFFNKIKQLTKYN